MMPLTPSWISSWRRCRCAARAHWVSEDVAEFSPAEEANWFRALASPLRGKFDSGWWHRKNCKSFAVRMNFLTFMLSVETLCEVLHMEHIRHERNGSLRRVTC